MKKTLLLEQTNFGYKLMDSYEVYLMNRTTKNSDKTPFCIKRVEPEMEYLTALFYDKKKCEFYGKTKTGEKVVVCLGLISATLSIN